MTIDTKVIKMIAFHGKQETKDFYISRVKKHREMDNLIQGQGWGAGKGCAVGCTLEKYDHAQYEIELGIPEWLARLEDTIFEGLQKERAMQWPEQFLSAIHPGADLEKVKTPFLIFVLEENIKTLDALPDMADWPDVKKAIELSKNATLQMIEAHKGKGDISAAEPVARSAAESARSAWSHIKCADKLVELLEECT